MRRLLHLILLVSSLGAWVRADTLTGELRGQVIDIGSGAPLNGVRMVLTSVDRGWTRTMVTDAQGRYVFLQLEPGNYSLRAESEGYYSLNRTDILIRLNRLKVLLPPFELRQVAAVPTREITLQSEVAKRAIIDLSAAGPTPVILAVTEEIGPDVLVSLGDSAIRFNFGPELLAGLPLRGARTYDQLALLAPGVHAVPFSGGEGPAVGLGVGTPGQFAVHGLRGRSNSFTVDGSDNNDEDIGVRRQGFAAEVPQTADSVQDFQILTAGPPAEFGRSAGAWANVVSRSGTSSTHGAISATFGHDQLQARGPFELPFVDSVNSGRLNGGGFTAPHARESQWTGALGGPLHRGLFYFVSADFRRESALHSGHFVVPASGERGLRTAAGFVPIAELGTFLAESNLPYSAVAGSGVYSLLPLPNHPSGPFGEHTYSQVRRARGRAFVGSAKLDWYPHDAISLTSRYNGTDDEQILPFTGTALNSSLGTATRTQNLSLSLNRTGDGWSQALRASYGRTRLTFPPENGDPLLFGSAPRPDGASTPTIDTSYGRFGPFGATGPIGQLVVQPYSPVGIDVFNFPQGRVNNSYQAAAVWSRTSGDHLLKLGLELRRTELNSFNDRNSRPLFVFTPGYISGTCMQNPACLFATPDGLLAGTDAAALGAPGAALQTLSTQPVPDSTIGLAFTRTELFLQDDWRISPRFSLNLGLRYELQSVPRDGQRRLERTFGIGPEGFSRLQPGDPEVCTGGTPGSPADRVICSGNAAFDRALQGWNAFLDGRTGIYRAGRNDFSPRVGFAWDPVGDGRSVLRGGYWLIHEAQMGAVTSQSRNVFPTFVPLNLDLNFRPPDGTLLNNPTFFTFTPTGDSLVTPGSLNRYHLASEAFATGLGTLFIQAPPFPGAPLSSNGLAFTLPEKNLGTAYAQHFVLAFERRFGKTLLAAGRYVGTRGRKLTRFQTPNAGLVATPVLFASPLLGLALLDLPPHPISGGQGRPQAELGAYTVFENSAGSEYHSLELSLERRFSAGLQFQIHWTWSHALDEVSDPFETRGAPATPQQIDRPHLEWGSSGFDARHRGTGFLLWQPPAGHPLHGWSLGTVIQARTGQPFTVTTALDRNLDGNLSDRLDGTAGLERVSGGNRLLRLAAGVQPLDLLASRGAAGRVSRNSFRSDGLMLVDLSLARRFAFGEEAAVELRVEVFNLLDRASYGIPIRVLESPGFGRAFDLQAEPRAARIRVKLSF